MSLVVIGIGSGRCGTMSLARLLDAQPHAHVTHETAPPLSWEPSPERTKAIFVHSTDFQHRFGQGKRIVGDVALWWLKSLDDLSAYFGALGVFSPLCPLKVVALCRDREETIESWLKQKAGKPYIREVVGKVFPGYPDANEREATGLFWDDYYREVKKRVKTDPNHYALFEMDALNSEIGQDRIFKFLGIPDHIHIPVHFHAHGKEPYENLRKELS